MLDFHHNKVVEVGLVSRVCADDVKAVESFYCGLLVPIAKAVVRSLGVREVEPEDLADQLFLRLCENNWRRLRTWDQTNLPGWTWRVCSRILFELVKDSARIVPLMDQHQSKLASDDATLDRLVEDETGFRLLEAIEALESPRDRRVIRMHYLQGMSLPSVAAELNVPIGTLYVVKRRALAKLRNVLEGRATNADASGA